MRILIAPDKFKGCLTAPEAAAIIAQAIQDLGPSHEITLLPIADGGEGTAAVVCSACNGEWINAASHDALGRGIIGRYVWLERDATAVIEMSAVAGLGSIEPSERDPLRATTFGVGELLLDAIHHGARKIILGLGGSATNDAGVGLACALGWKFAPFTDHRRWVTPEDFLQITEIIAPKREAWPQIIAACDVTNPLLGANGATRIFGPQKGADAKDLGLLEMALTHLASVAATQIGRDERDVPGAGAAGGLGYGLLTFANARLVSGFDLVAGLISLEKAVAEADLIFTGEGSLDGQTLDGKGPAGVARLAQRYNKPVIAVAGRVSSNSAALFSHCEALSDGDTPIAQSMREVRPRLAEATTRAIAWFLA